MEAGTKDSDPETETESMPKTRRIVGTMLERVELLLYVNIDGDAKKVDCRHAQKTG